MSNPICYINTDLVLVSAGDLTSLASTLSSKGMVCIHLAQHPDELWYARFEISPECDEAQSNMVAFLAILESLDIDARRIWFACISRVFDIGYRSGDDPPGFRNDISAETLARTVAVGASICITLYPANGSSLRL